MQQDTTHNLAPLPLMAATTLAQPEKYFIGVANGSMMVGYCPINQVAAVYHFHASMWSCWAPMDFEAFLVTLKGRGLDPGNSLAAQRWRAVCRRKVADDTGGKDSGLH